MLVPSSLGIREREPSSSITPGEVKTKDDAGDAASILYVVSENDNANTVPNVSAHSFSHLGTPFFSSPSHIVSRTPTLSAATLPTSLAGGNRLTYKYIGGCSGCNCNDSNCTKRNAIIGAIAVAGALAIILIVLAVRFILIIAAGMRLGRAEVIASSESETHWTRFDSFYCFALALLNSNSAADE
ncbi:hypothetical protein C8R43DRAFT_959092 [Mycena crocata]|nr:hypothetical protein C8R43DRAFT_959092 [Mycena crocata]